jgi:hypothetical protein
MKTLGGLVVVLLLVLAAYYVGKNSNSASQLTAGEKIPSPDTAIVKLKALCAVKNYEAIALSSLRPDGKSYALITREEITREKHDPLKDYAGKAESLCKAMANSKRTDKSQLTGDTWQYRFNFSLDNASSATFGVHYFQGEWRFVLPDSAYL